MNLAKKIRNNAIEKVESNWANALDWLDSSKTISAVSYLAFMRDVLRLDAIERKYSRSYIISKLRKDNNVITLKEAVNVDGKVSLGFCMSSW